MLRGNLACVQICTAVKAPNAPGTPRLFHVKFCHLLNINDICLSFGLQTLLTRANNRYLKQYGRRYRKAGI